jgi:DNA-binding PucR family transcriptional regulator
LLQKLYLHSEQSKSNYILLLYTYLNCNQNASYTGKVLNIHRNNVVYHISRINEILGVDLSNPSTCFKLLISIVLIELYGFTGDQ